MLIIKESIEVACSLAWNYISQSKKKEWLTNQLEILSTDTGMSVKELLNVAYTDQGMRKYWGSTRQWPY